MHGHKLDTDVGFLLCLAPFPPWVCRVFHGQYHVFLLRWAGKSHSNSLLGSERIYANRQQLHSKQHTERIKLADDPLIAC
jgi:hypothetical protein